MKLIRTLFIAFTAIAIASCSGNKQEATENQEETQKEAIQEEVSNIVPSDEDIFAIPENAKVYFTNIEDGAILTSPITVVMGIDGMMLEPAGEKKVGYGHHHIFINRDFMPTKEVIPMDMAEGVIASDAVLTFHYGGGQSEAELNLAPGKYQLTLQYADGVHRSYGEQLSASLNVEVQ